MNKSKVEALKGVVAATLSALVAARVIDPGLSLSLTGVVVALLALYAAFSVIPPQKVRAEQNLKD